MSQAPSEDETRDMPDYPRRSILKKEESRTRRESDRRLRFDEDSISKSQISDIEELKSMTDIYPELAEDLNFDLKKIDESDVEWEKIRAVKRKSFELKAKSEKLNEFTLARAVCPEDDSEDKERPFAEHHANGGDDNFSRK